MPNFVGHDTERATASSCLRKSDGSLHPVWQCSVRIAFQTRH